MESSLAALTWLEPWHPDHSRLERELAREVGPNHPLAGRRAVEIGRRQDSGAVLFHLPDGPAPYAVVHLTFSRARETGAEWPRTVLYDSLEDWIERCMKPDHAAWAGRKVS